MKRLMLVMRKAAGIAMAAILAVMCMTACGNDEKVIGTTADSGKNTEAQAPGTETVPDGKASGAQDADEPGAGMQSGRGYVFVYGDAVVEIDAEAEAVIAALGEPISYFEAASCAFQGLDKMYTYSGFEVDTYPVEGKDYISAVILKDDSVTTAEGVCIGDSLSGLEKAYGTDSTGENGMIVYEKDGMKLCFIVQNDTVISIEYRSAVLD